MKRIEVLNHWNVRQLADDEMPHGVPDAAAWKEPVLPENGWLDAGTSFSVQEALLRAGRLSDEVLDGKTESAAWVAEKNWLYCCDFEARPCTGEQFLALKGVDTVANVWLNGEFLGRCDDMFIPHRFRVTGLVRPQNRMLISVALRGDAAGPGIVPGRVAK